jgi:hypothetical protein
MDDHAEFLRRAAAGDFAVEVKTPRRRKSPKIQRHNGRPPSDARGPLMVRVSA